MSSAHPLGARRATLMDQPEPLREIAYETPIQRAVNAIREGDLDVWYEPDYRVARKVAVLCPECRVYSSHGHLRLLEEDPA